MSGPSASAASSPLMITAGQQQYKRLLDGVPILVSAGACRRPSRTDDYEAQALPRPISVTVNVKRQRCSTTDVEEPVFAIELTREDDNQFLYSSSIGRQLFAAIKEEQHLLVDFGHFGQMFVELLEKVKQEGGQSDDPKFKAVLDCSSSDDESSAALLKIVESNRFSQLTHLSIPFSRATDEEIKKHLCDKLQWFKHVQQKLFHSRSSENELKKSCKKMEENLKLKIAEMNSWQSTSAKELASVKQKWREDVEKLESGAKRAKEEFSSERTNLQQKVEFLEATCSELKAENEKSLDRIAHLEEENEAFREHFDRLNSQLDAQGELKKENRSMRKALKQREVELGRGEAAYKKLTNRLEEVLDELAAETADKDKGCSVIRTMMQEKTEFQNKLAELKLKTKQSDEQVSRTVEENYKLRTERDSSVTERERAAEELKQAKAQLESCRKEILDKNRVISTLNASLMLKSGQRFQQTAAAQLAKHYRPVLGLVQQSAAEGQKAANQQQTSTPTTAAALKVRLPFKHHSSNVGRQEVHNVSPIVPADFPR